MQSESTPRISVSEDAFPKNTYADFRIKKSSVKWVVLFAVVLFVAFLGLLLASVLISTQITKDIEVKDGELVSSKKEGSIIKTSEKLYTQRVTLDTPLEVVKSVKTISVAITQGGVFKFVVVGFERIPGRKLVFHGHTHSASINADGSVQITKSFTSGSKRDVDLRTGESADVESLLAGSNARTYVSVASCEDLTSLNPALNYRLESNLACNLSAPLPSFKGFFNGNGYTLTITMNRPNGEVALFQELDGAAVFNLIVEGSFAGAGRCAAFAVQVLPGTTLVSNKAFASVVCDNVASTSRSTNVILAAPFVAEVVASVQSSQPVTFQYLVSAAHVTVPAGASSYQGGYYAVGPESTSVISLFNYFLSYYENIADLDHFSPIGITIGGGKKRNPCGNPNYPTYNSYCWNLFNYSNGLAWPHNDYWTCCEGYDPCTGCIYDPDPAGCRFVLCRYGKKRSVTKGVAKPVRTPTTSRSIDISAADIVQHIHVPFIEY